MTDVQTHEEIKTAYTEWLAGETERKRQDHRWRVFVIIASTILLSLAAYRQFG